MSKEITQLTNVTVDKISLVSKDHNPAVPKATTKYALFKTQAPDQAKVKNTERLDKIINDLTAKKTNDKLDKIIDQMTL